MPYTKNLEVLKEHYPDIYKELNSDKLNKDKLAVEVETAKNGELIVKVKDGERWVYLNSKYNPSSEADKYMSDMYDMPEQSLLAVFGMSNCAFIRAFTDNNTDDTCVVVYEPSVDIFLTVIKHIDITDILENPRVNLIIKGLNGHMLDAYMDNTIRTANVKTNKYITLPKYAQLFEEDFAYYHKVIEENNIKMIAIKNTVRLYGKRVSENSIYNLRYLKNSSSSVDLVDKFPEDFPAIVVAAGPSLEKNMHLLNKAKGKALIVVVDTAIPKVLDAGIIPDMVIAIDFVKPLKYFENPLLKDVPILCDTDMNKDILDRVRPDKCIFFTADSMIWASLFEEEGSEIRKINSGGSVATALIANYIHWGIKRIILVGQDLAFTESKGHVGEDKMIIPEDDPIYTKVDAIGGGQVYTRYDFLSYIRWIENQSAIHNEIEFIDATEGGALKEHTKVMTLEEAIDTYCTKEFDVAKVIDELPVLFKGPEGEAKIKVKLESIAANLRKLKRKLSDVTVDCHKAVLMMERKDYNKKELKRINDAMEKFEESYVEMDERVFIEKYLSDAETEFESDLFVIEKDELEEALRLYKKSEKYYRSIADAIPEILDIIQDCLDKMEKEN